MLFDLLPQHLWFDIFSRLPIKTLVCCCCSCKSLLSFLCHPSFSSLLLKKSCMNPFIFFRRYSKRFYKQYYTLQLDDESFDVGKDEFEMPIECHYGRAFNIVGSFNGVICLSDDQYAATNVIILWNPGIRKSLELPVPSITVDTHGEMDIVVGFGIDTTFDYKVVRLAYIGGSYCIPNRVPPLVEVYSLRKRLWKRIANPGPLCYICNKMTMSCPSYSQCFLRKTCHWPGWKDHLWSAIVTYNFSDEVFGEVKLPRPLEGSKCSEMDLKVMDFRMMGVLTVIQLSSERVSTNNAYIWLMKSYGVVDSWTLLYKCCNQAEYPRHRSFLYRKTGEILIITGGGKELHDLICINRNLQKTIGQVKGKPSGFFVSSYVESLALLKEGKSVPVTTLERPVINEGEEDDDSEKEVTEYESERSSSDDIIFEDVERDDFTEDDEDEGEDEGEDGVNEGQVS